MRFWPETGTTVAVRRSNRDQGEVAAPFGLDELFDLIVRPTPHFAAGKRLIYSNRIQAKRWLEIWPLLRVV
jgi:hypothetical protein